MKVNNDLAIIAPQTLKRYNALTIASPANFSVVNAAWSRKQRTRLPSYKLLN